MNRRTRYLLNRLANGIETAAEALVGWLRAKAERKARPRPLAFPSPFEEMIDRITSDAMMAMGKRISADIVGVYGTPKLVRITDDIPYVVPGDRAANASAYSLITYGRSTPIYKDGI